MTINQHNGRWIERAVFSIFLLVLAFLLQQGMVEQNNMGKDVVKLEERIDAHKAQPSHGAVLNRISQLESSMAAIKVEITIIRRLLENPPTRFDRLQ